MLALILIEKLASLFIEDKLELFGRGPKKDKDGYTCLRFPPTYYALSVIMAIVTLFLFYLVTISPAGEFWFGIFISALFGLTIVLLFLFVKNMQYRFNDKEIIRRSLFKKETILFWDNCSFRPWNFLSHQVRLYNHEHTFRIYDKMIGFNHLMEMTRKKLSKTQAELGLP